MGEHTVLFVIPAVLIIAGILALALSTPRKRLKRINKLMNQNEDVLKEMAKKSAEISGSARNEFLHENEDMLKEMSKKGAEINSEGIKITAKAVKEGFTETKLTKFCKNCGKEIDENSKFCNFCGKEQ